MTYLVYLPGAFILFMMTVVMYFGDDVVEKKVTRLIRAGLKNEYHFNKAVPTFDTWLLTVWKGIKQWSTLLLGYSSELLFMLYIASANLGEMLGNLKSRIYSWLKELNHRSVKSVRRLSLLKSPKLLQNPLIQRCGLVQMRIWKKWKPQPKQHETVRALSNRLLANCQILESKSQGPCDT